MSDEKNRLAVGGPQVKEEIAHDLAGLGVERPERFVHKKDFWIADQHLRQTDTLALSAGQHMRVAVAECVEAYARKPFPGTGPRIADRDPRDLETNRHILCCSFHRKQRVSLEKVPGLAVQSGECLTKNSYVAAGRRKQASSDIEQGRLAATGWSDDRNELPVGDMKRRALNCGVNSTVGEVECNHDIIECDCRARRAGILNIGRSHGGMVRHASPPAFFLHANYPASRGLQSPPVKGP